MEQEVPNELLLVIDEGDDDDFKPSPSQKLRPSGVYYKSIERKMTLKKKRVNVSRPLAVF